jgi:hypothetical protein
MQFPKPFWEAGGAQILLEEEPTSLGDGTEQALLRILVAARKRVKHDPQVALGSVWATRRPAIVFDLKSRLRLRQPRGPQSPPKLSLELLHMREQLLSSIGPKADGKKVSPTARREHRCQAPLGTDAVVQNL